MNTLHNIISQIGYFGPYTLIIFTIILMILCNVYTYDYFIILGVWQLLSFWINGILKNTIKQPRPKGMRDANFLDKKDSLQYGMPSGHAQVVIGFLSFLTLEFQNAFVIIFALLQSVITLWQRFVYNKHTFSQLLAGSAIGSALGYVLHLMFNKYRKMESENRVKNKCNKD